MQRYAYVGNNPANFLDPSGKCPWSLCLPPVPSPENIAGWGERRLDELKSVFVDPVVTATGYVDLNGTVCLPGLGVCGTAGVQASIRQGFHPYVGGGIGGGAGLSATWAPGQSISTGWSCGLQVSVGPYAGQAGAGGIRSLESDKEGRGTSHVPFGEFGMGIGALNAITCFYVF